METPNSYLCCLWVTRIACQDRARRELCELVSHNAYPRRQRQGLILRLLLRVQTGSRQPQNCTTQLVSGRVQGGSKLLPRHSKLGPCVPILSSQIPGFPGGICTILPAAMRFLITSTFPSRTLPTSPPPGSSPGSSNLPSAGHAPHARALLLGPFFLFLFCLHIRHGSGPELPHLCSVPNVPRRAVGLRKCAGESEEGLIEDLLFPIVRLEPRPPVFPQRPFQRTSRGSSRPCFSMSRKESPCLPL